MPQTIFGIFFIFFMTTLYTETVYRMLAKSCT